MYFSSHWKECAIRVKTYPYVFLVQRSWTFVFQLEMLCVSAYRWGLTWINVCSCLMRIHVLKRSRAISRNTAYLRIQQSWRTYTYSWTNMFTSFHVVHDLLSIDVFVRIYKVLNYDVYWRRFLAKCIVGFETYLDILFVQRTETLIHSYRMHCRPA